MVLRQGWAVNSVSIDAPDARLAMAGLVVRDTSHTVRSGVFGSKVRSLVTARTDMKVDVAFFNAVFSRGAAYGAVLLSNDGTTQVTIDTAPTANSRIDVVYVLTPDTSQGDVAGSPSFQVAKGTAAASPQKPSIPAGGFELATVQVPSNATTTSSANVVITQTFKFTAAHGGRIPFRSISEIQAETKLAEGTLAYLDDPTNPQTYRYDGSSWRLWEQTPQTVNFALATPGLNLGSGGGITALVSVSAGIARIDFRGRFSGTGMSWGDIRYPLPFPAAGVFGTTPGAGAGTGVMNDSNGGLYGFWCILAGDGTWRVLRTGADNGASASWSTSQPFNPDTADTFVGSLTYPVA